MDITAASASAFVPGDSNPGTVRVSWGGVGRNVAHNLALLGDDVELLTIFGGGLFGPVLEDACSKAGIGTGHSETAPDGANSFFVSVNGPDGEMIGGVADMKASERMTPEWLAARLDVINGADAVVADANSPADSLAWLIDHCERPLYLDAVSSSKAVRILQAVELSRRKSIFTLKCNALEDRILSCVEGVTRRFVSAGSKGLKVFAEGTVFEFPALPCTVRSVTGGGDALLAGIVHAGAHASVEQCAREGLLCAKCAVESPEAVSEEIKYLEI